MTDRQSVYYGQVLRAIDILSFGQQMMVGNAKIAEAVLGTSTSVSGFTLVPTGPATMSAVLSAGIVFQQANLEASPLSALPADTHTIVKEGRLLDPTTLTFTPPVTVGYAQNFLVEVQYQDVDAGSIVLPYANPSNPAVPYNGPGNAGTANNTVRKGVAAVQIKAGVAATAGTQTSPSQDVGWVGLFVVVLTQGQTTVTAGNISVFPNAPFISTTLPQVPVAVQSGKFVYAVDTGVVNTVVASLSPAPPLLLAGMGIVVKVAAPNTNSTPTLNLNGFGAIGILKQNGGAVARGDVAGFVQMIFDGTNWRMSGPSYSDSRRRLTANLTVYVRADGNDANDGTANTVANAFLTIQAAYAAAQGYDTGGFAITIQLGISGTYSGCVFAPGPQNMVVNGLGTSTIVQCVPGVNYCFLCQSANIRVSNIQFSYNYTGSVQAVEAAVWAQTGSNVVVNTCYFQSTTARTNYFDEYCESGATIRDDAGVIYLNGSQARAGHIFAIGRYSAADGVSSCFFNGASSAFTQGFAVASSGGIILFTTLAIFGAMTTPTGPRYSVSFGGQIYVYGQGINFLPGNAAGSTSSNGFYG